MKATIFLLFIIILCGCAESTSKKNDNNSSETTTALVIKKDRLYCQKLQNGDCSYRLCETKGWIAHLDSTLMGNSRILVVYKPDETINYAKPIGIYSNVVFKEIEGFTFKEFLNGERKIAIEKDEKVFDGESIKTNDNKIAVIKKYFIEKIREYFAIAYIDEPKYIIMVTFSCKDFNDYNTYFNSFKEIVKSYKYLGVRAMNSMH